MKTKLTDLADELKIEFTEAVRLKNEHVSPQHLSGTGRNTWLTEAGVQQFIIASEAKEAAPKLLKAKVLHEAANSRWVFAIIDGVDGKKPVLIPPRLRDRLIGKSIYVHAITDANGTTYRHESLTS